MHLVSCNRAERFDRHNPPHVEEIEDVVESGSHRSAPDRQGQKEGHLSIVTTYDRIDRNVKTTKWSLIVREDVTLGETHIFGFA